MASIGLVGLHTVSGQMATTTGEYGGGRVPWNGLSTVQCGTYHRHHNGRRCWRTYHNILLEGRLQLLLTHSSKGWPTSHMARAVTPASAPLTR